MGYHNQLVNYLSSAKYGAVTAWATAAAKTVGQIVRQTAPTSGNERLWLCYVAGTTHATTEPTWTTSRGDKIATDGTVSWIEVTGLPAVNADSANTPNWTNGAKSQFNNQGHLIKDVAGTHYFICTTNGTGGSGAEPTWNTAALGNTTVDNGATWTYIGLVSSFSTHWGAPHATITLATNNNWMENAGAGQARRTIFLGHDHAESRSSNFIGLNTANYTNNLNNGNSLDIVCVSTAGSVPPVSADLSTAGAITTTGSNGIAIAGGTYRWVYGITFTAGTSANISIDFSGENSDRFFENCVFALGAGTGSGANMNFNGSCGRQHFKGCTFTFSNTGHNFGGGRVNCEFDNCTFNGSSPTVNGLFLGSAGGYAIFRNCDFSAWTNAIFHSGTSNVNSTFIFRDCKMPTGWTPGDNFANGVTNTSETLIFSRCNTAGVANQWQFWQNDGAGNNIQADNLTARVGGLADAGTPVSWRVTTKTNVTMNSSDARPPMLAEWNPVTGANVTATIFGVINAAALPTNDYCFFDIDYLGNSDTLGVRKSSRIADYLATPAAVTADTSDWTTGAVAARQNTHTYAVGDAIKLASNAGRIFFCTASSGNTAGSEPGGYASAVDGGSVTDGSATFCAGMRFKMAVTLTSPQPQLAGNVYAQIRFGAPSVIIYFDPSLILT
jgi:hypothetical protein